MKLTSMKAALAVMSAGMVLVSCGNEGPNLKGNLKMDRDTLLIQVVWQKKSLLDTVVFAKKKKPSTMLDLVRQAGAELAGMGFIIEKEFQHGRDVLAEAGVRVESLAIIESLGNCTIKIRQ